MEIRPNKAQFWAIFCSTWADKKVHFSYFTSWRFVQKRPSFKLFSDQNEPMGKYLLGIQNIPYDDFLGISCLTLLCVTSAAHAEWVSQLDVGAPGACCWPFYEVSSLSYECLGRTPSLKNPIHKISPMVHLLGSGEICRGIVWPCCGSIPWDMQSEYFHLTRPRLWGAF